MQTYMHVRTLLTSFPVPKRAEMRAGNEAIAIHTYIHLCASLACSTIVNNIHIALTLSKSA